MRFRAPRSISPSPVRRSKSQQTRAIRHTSFGLNSSDEDDSYSSESDEQYSSDEDPLASSSDDSDSFCYASESNVPIRPPKQLDPVHRSPNEQQYIQETVAAIRLRTRHHDPYEEWEREMRKESLRVARQTQSTLDQSFQSTQASLKASQSASLRLKLEHEQNEITSLLERLRLKQQEDESKLREAWVKRDKLLWDRVEEGIRLDEGKARVKFEEEKRRREEEERKVKEERERREAEEKRRREEDEKKRREEEERKKREEEEERKRKEEEELREREAKEREEKVKAESEARKKVGMSTGEEDWRMAREHLYVAKTQGTQLAKKNPEMKKLYLQGRRQIVPKVGQVTNDAETIERVSKQLIQCITHQPTTSPPSSFNPTPSQPNPPAVYTALLSALSKALLNQAETEVTADKKSAEPLARVAYNCLLSLQGFPEVFYARMLARIGGWVIPIIGLPPRDFDGRGWGGDREKRKVMGYKDTDEEMEGEGVYLERVVGVLRLYFSILKMTHERPVGGGPWQTTRLWVWLTRVMNDRRMIGSLVGGQLVYILLTTAGSEMKDIWGVQFVKLLQLLWDGTLSSSEGEDLVKVGGNSEQAVGVRNRLRMAVENVLNGPG